MDDSDEEDDEDDEDSLGDGLDDLEEDPEEEEILHGVDYVPTGPQHMTIDMDDGEDCSLNKMEESLLWQRL